jgi:hypothetical protein
MESHVQAWFTINPELRAKENIIAAYEDESKVDPANFKLGGSQVLVQVKRVGSRVKTKDSKWVHLKVDDEIRMKIREWITNEKTFDPLQVDVGDDEVLVVVIGECCGVTSEGNA